MKIRISADSTCDLSPQQIREKNIAIKAMIVNMGDNSYYDGVDIVPETIFAYVAAGNPLCTTSAVPIGEYEEHFAELLRDADAVIHINIGSGFSSTHRNAVLAAQEMENVYVVDSRNLSTGHGLVVLEACRLAETCDDPEKIVEKLNAYAPLVDASFLLDRLDYMKKGGRCSTVAALGANLLKLKPCIEVIDNKMVVGKKYRGNYAKCMDNYVRERLTDSDALNLREIFITHTPVSDEVLQTVKTAVRESASFENTYETTAGCTISCHCGEGCLGVLYVRKSPKIKE
ncbi:MAG: DegV family protein [Ruminococcaceae bacterium]|nr:DegV family protein [Oscillospiraceae bacterium]